MGLHNLLISLHLDSHTQSRLMTQKEYIIPMDFDTASFSLFNKQEGESAEGDEPPVRQFIPSIESSVSVRPIINIQEWKYVQLASKTPLHHIWTRVSQVFVNN